jgi:hypothetical protein
MELSMLAQNQINNSQVAVEHDLRDQISELSITKTQTLAAIQLGISVSYLNDILHGRSGISDGVADQLGWKRMTVFVRPGGAS